MTVMNAIQSISFYNILCRCILIDQVNCKIPKARLCTLEEKINIRMLLKWEIASIWKELSE